MSLFVYIAKLCIVAIYVYVIITIVRFKQNEKGVEIKFDTLSMIEIAMGVGLALVSVGAVITKETAMFTLGLCCVSIIFAVYQSQRIIVCGSQKALIRLKPVRIRDITGVSNTMFSLVLETKEKKIKIYIPLTGNNVLREKIVDKIR